MVNYMALSTAVGVPPTRYLVRNIHRWPVVSMYNSCN